MIGIYDSGIGGLSIYNSVKELLPNEDYIYVADKKFFPYGTKPSLVIKYRGDKIVSWLKNQDVKLIIIACNTSTVSALSYLRKKNPEVPIVGTVPVIKTCAEQTKSGKIGVMCTPKTARSGYQKKLIREFAPDKTVEVMPCPNLVEQIERGEVKRDSEALTKPLYHLLLKNIDTLALGCTHFPLIAEEIKEIAGDDVLVLDSGEAIARQAKRILETNGSVSTGEEAGKTFFYTTAAAQKFDIIASRYLKDKVRSKTIQI